MKETRRRRKAAAGKGKQMETKSIEMETERIKVAEAAQILKVSQQFIRIGMQQERLPIGTAVKMSSQWTYLISAKMLQEYTGIDVAAALANIRK